MKPCYSLSGSKLGILPSEARVIHLSLLRKTLSVAELFWVYSKQSRKFTELHLAMLLSD